MVEYEDEEINDIVTLTLCDFVYHEDPDEKGGLLCIQVHFKRHSDENFKREEDYIDFEIFKYPKNHPEQQQKVLGYMEFYNHFQNELIPTCFVPN